jgi:hypothetical protein
MEEDEGVDEFRGIHLSSLMWLNVGGFGSTSFGGKR